MEMSPEIARSVQLEADLIRELVKLEREKRGLDLPKGKAELYPNKEKVAALDPDFTGWAHIAGRKYRAAGWLSAKNEISIAFLPRKAK
jgi:hypothetical protein